MTEPDPELRVQLTRRADGAVVLRCVRKDGSATWQRHERHALFFSFHDLGHFAVETVLRFRQGFYGLLADGWDIADTGGKGARGKLPVEAVVVEHLVGLIERERAGGAAPLSPSEFNAQVRQLTEGSGVERTFTGAELDAVRSRIAQLHDAWARTAPGSTFELEFDRRHGDQAVGRLTTASSLNGQSKQEAGKRGKSEMER